MLSIQRAGMWKRISAAMFDGILLGIAAVLFALILSWALGYDGYIDTLNERYDQYGAQYGVDFHMSLDEHDQLTSEQSANLEAAYQALGADDAAVYAYNMMIRLTLIIVSISILLAYLALEFIVPMLFKNGQTLGKRIFSLGLMDTELVRVNGRAAVYPHGPGQVHAGNHGARADRADDLLWQPGADRAPSCCC